MPVSNLTKKTMTAKLPLEMIERLDQHAQALDRSRAWVVKHALQQWLDDEDYKIQTTLAALEEMEQEGGIDNVDALAYLESVAVGKPVSFPESQK